MEFFKTYVCGPAGTWAEHRITSRSHEVPAGISTTTLKLPALASCQTQCKKLGIKTLYIGYMTIREKGWNCLRLSNPLVQVAIIQQLHFVSYESILWYILLWSMWWRYVCAIHTPVVDSGKILSHSSKAVRVLQSVRRHLSKLFERQPAKCGRSHQAVWGFFSSHIMGAVPSYSTNTVVWSSSNSYSSSTPTQWLKAKHASVPPLQFRYSALSVALAIASRVGIQFDRQTMLAL